MPTETYTSQRDSVADQDCRYADQTFRVSLDSDKFVPFTQTASIIGLSSAVEVRLFSASTLLTPAIFSFNDNVACCT